eukprot:4454587-Pleurochrysis_carterae.AAC.1
MPQQVPSLLHDRTPKGSHSRTPEPLNSSTKHEAAQSARDLAQVPSFMHHLAREQQAPLSPLAFVIHSGQRSKNGISLGAG